MGPRLAAAHDGMPGACHVLDAKFEPGVRAVLLYEQAGRLLRGDLVPDGDLAGADPARMVEPGVLVSPFPHDPELPSLPSVMDPVCLGHAMSRALSQAGVGPIGRVPRSRMRLLRYRPGKRVTLLVAQGPRPPVYVAKAYHSAAKAAAVVEEAPMLQSATTPPARCRSRPSSASSPTWPWWCSSAWQEHRSTSCCTARTAASRRCGRPGPRRAGARELHATVVPSRRQRSVEAELVRFGERASRISTVDPVLGRAAADLAERLMTTLDRLPPAHTGVVHGDCKPSQFLITERGVVLLDLDHVGISDQAADVGTFLASLRQQDVRFALAGRSGRPSASSASLAELFLAGYRAGGGTCRELSRTHWQEAVALERKALRAFARAPRSPVPRALIVEAHACLDRQRERHDQPARPWRGAPAAPGDFLRSVRLFRRFMGGRKVYVLGIVFLLVEAVTAVFEPYPVAFLVDFLQGNKPAVRTLGFPTILSSERLETILVLTVAIILIAAVNSAADSFTEVCMARGGRSLGYGIRVEMYSHLQRLPLGYHDKKRTGDVLTRVTGDVLVVEDFVVKSVSNIFGSLMVLVGSFAFLLYQSWSVALVALAVIPMLGLVSNFFSRRIKVASKTQRDREGDLASTAQEMLSSIRLVQSYGRGTVDLEKFSGQTGKSMFASLRAANIQAQFSFVIAIVEALSIAAVIWLGVWLVDRQSITVGTLILFVLLLQNMFKPARKIVSEWYKVGKVFASVERIDDLLDGRSPSPTTPTRSRPLPSRDASPSSTWPSPTRPSTRTGRGSPAGHRCCATSTSRWHPGRWSRSSATAGRARARSRSWSHGSTTPTRDRCWSTDSTCAA